MSDPEERVCPVCDHLEVTFVGARCPSDGAALLTPSVLAGWPADPLLGRVLGDRYAVVGVLGEGGAGPAYDAFDGVGGRRVVIKAFRAPTRRTDRPRLRFLEMVEALAPIDDPALARLLDHGEADEGLWFVVLERVDGPTMAEVLRGGPLGLARALFVATQVLRALAVAHGGGVVHRGVKPENIVLRSDARGAESVKLLDLGVPRLSQRLDVVDTQLGSVASIVLRAPHYAAPETASGQTSTPQTDLYCVGVLLFHMLTGRPPFPGAAPVDVLMAHLTAPAPRLPTALGLPLALDTVCQRALAKSPGDRYPDAAAMLCALAAAMPPESGGTTVLTVVPRAPGDDTRREPARAVPPRPRAGGDPSGSPRRPPRAEPVPPGPPNTAPPRMRRPRRLIVATAVLVGALSGWLALSIWGR